MKSQKNPLYAILLPCLVLPALLPPGASHAQGGPPLSLLHPVSGTVRTTWVGNSFSGAGGPNGFGYWVQNGVGRMQVAPDGTVFAGTEWDEAGRCAGLYKDGKPGRVLLRAPDGPLAESAWGWGTANQALAVGGRTLYVASAGKRLLRFDWEPGDLDSGRFRDAADLPAAAVGLSTAGNTLAIAYADGVELRRTGDLTVTAQFKASRVRDVCLAPGGAGLWLLAEGQVQRFSAAGQRLGGPVPGLQSPSAISLDNHGQLIVCDNGPRQQVLFFDVSSTPKLGTPKLIRAFGVKGGLSAGVPGEAAPRKLFGLRGAGTDAKGNLYVALSFGNGPGGNCFLRSFRPDGTLRWQVMSTAFVDTFGFDPGADGEIIYGRTGIFALDLSQTVPGREGTLRALSMDPVHAPADSRLTSGKTMLLRRLGGRRVLYSIGQYAGGYEIYTFDGPHGSVAKKVDQIGASEQWAWDIDDRGGIWHGDAPGKTIRCYPFAGWTTAGRPRYDWSRPQTWPWPEGWGLIRRVHYDAAQDTLYLSGYRVGEAVETWGVVGASLGRYNGWRHGGGAAKALWLTTLPRDGNSGKEGPLTPQALCWAGDYVFLGMSRPVQGRQAVFVLRASDGGAAGALVPDAAVVGDQQGWEDMPYAVQALRRRSGEYLILAEEDDRGKNLLYRWRPLPQEQL